MDAYAPLFPFFLFFLFIFFGNLIYERNQSTQLMELWQQRFIVERALWGEVYRFDVRV